VEKQTQVFNVAVAYVLWLSTVPELDLAKVDSRLEGVIEVSDPDQCEQAVKSLNELADRLDDAQDRQALLRRVCLLTGVDAAALEQSRVISFMNSQEARDLAQAGIDLQLHTHRHCFPAGDKAAAKQEIEDNRRYLAQIARSPLVHFCYPSGVYEVHQHPWLEMLGIASATTTKSGFNTRRTPKLELRRFLDSEHISPIEFEAEMSGLLELVRHCGYRI
jgi:GAF domain-containing protein